MIKKIVATFIISLSLSTQLAYADFQTGMQAYNKRDYATALLLLKPEAETGNTIAGNIVGVIYMNALGVSRDDVEAMKWYRLAADKGYAVAQTNVGFLYENGRGVERNLAEARKWYEKAAAQGDSRAVAFLRRVSMEEQRPPFPSGAPVPPQIRAATSVGGSAVMPNTPQAAELAHVALATSMPTGDIRLLAKVVTRTLDNPKRWNEQSAEWKPVVEAVYADLLVINKRFDQQREGIRQQRERLLGGIYMVSISSSQLKELLAYYNSNAGRHYQEFLQELNTLIINATVDLTGEIAVTGTNDLADISKLPVREQRDFSKNGDERLRVLRLSRIYRELLAMNNTKVAIGAGNIVGIVAARYGDEVDHLNNKFKNELDSFEKFSESAATQAEIAGLVKVETRPIPAETQLKNELLAEIASHRAKWLQLYTNHTNQSPGSPPANKI